MELKLKGLSLFVSLTALLAGSLALQAQKKAPASLKAPEVYRVDFELSTGPVVIEVTRAQAPVGADHFYNLVRARYFDGARFFRVIPGFMAQFGLAADPKLSEAWDVPIQDDPVKATNARGSVSFAAMSTPNSRSEQLFINFAANARLDGIGFAPIGKVVSGMENVDKIYSGDRENPQQDVIEKQGNAYLEKSFPHLDYIKTARIAP
jgi:peptidyl-prolyl cis-trans isomerase A (cyclophilin A)